MVGGVARFCVAVRDWVCLQVTAGPRVIFRWCREPEQETATDALEHHRLLL